MTMPALPEAVDALEEAAERLRSAVRARGVHDEVERRMLRLADELSSHALAAEVLVRSGASSSSVTEILRRAGELTAR